jgi:hypothetical protein
LKLNEEGPAITNHLDLHLDPQSSPGDELLGQLINVENNNANLKSCLRKDIDLRFNI